MGTCTVYRLKGADFSGQGLPNIFPFVARDNLEYAFNFSNKNLKDMSGKTADLIPYRSTYPAENPIHIIDHTVVSIALNGLGVRVAGGCLVSTKRFSQIPIDGSLQFSILFVGGWDGTTIPTHTANPAIATFLDIGNGVSQSNGPMMQFYKTDRSIGARLRDGSRSNIGSIIEDSTRQYFMVLTYDGNQWVLHNKTTRTKSVKTNVELGITKEITAPTVNVPLFDYIGHGFVASTIAGLPVIACQAARWMKVLSDAEIEAQYQLSKSLLNELI